MKYTSPVDENNKPYYVPIVIKNRDRLIGYLKGLNDTKELVKEVFTSLDINLNTSSIEGRLDSMQYNDVLENGKREHELSADEKKDYLMNLVAEASEKLNSSHVENGIQYDNILEVECLCGFGVYSWREYEEIPKNQFKCTNCGKVLIDYTKKDCYKYEFDEGF